MNERKVLLPFDGSPAAQRAMEHLAATERPGESSVHVLNVQHPTIDDDVYLPEFVDRAKLMLREASRYLEARDIAHTAEVAIGSACDVIVSSAKEKGCTAIVMGVRNPLMRLLSGSVSRHVVRKAGLPVTLVKANGQAVSYPLPREAPTQEESERSA